MTAGMTDSHKAFFLTVALGALEAVFQSEVVINSHGARTTRLSRGIDQQLKLIDIYRPTAWPPEMMGKACSLVDEINERIKEVFGVNSHSPIVSVELWRQGNDIY